MSWMPGGDCVGGERGGGGVVAGGYQPSRGSGGGGEKVGGGCGRGGSRPVKTARSPWLVRVSSRARYAAHRASFSAVRVVGSRALIGDAEIRRRGAARHSVMEGLLVNSVTGSAVYVLEG